MMNFLNGYMKIERDNMSIDALLKDIRKTTESTTFENSKYGKITRWINTGDYGLNRIISGDIHKGIPSGKVILISGESQTGKSLIAAQIAANSINEEKFDHIFYFDSEGGALEKFFENRGCPKSKVEQILVENVEDATVKILETFSKIAEYKKKNPEAYFLCILDSLGALVPSKLYSDAEKGKQVADMGSRARLCNNLLKGLTIPCLKSDTAMIVTNHVYDDPSSMYPSKIKNQSGGKGAQYVARIILQCSKLYEKDEEGEASYKASVLKFFCTKNGFVKPFYETEMYLDFSKGSMKYFGLLKPAIEYGFIKNANDGKEERSTEARKSSKYFVPSYSKEEGFKLKNIVNDEKIWSTFLDEFNTKSKEVLSYSNTATELSDDQLDEVITTENEQSPSA